MTPKQKRNLLDLANRVSALGDVADPLKRRVLATTQANRISAAAAESPPKCGTCKYFEAPYDGDYVAFCTRQSINTGHVDVGEPHEVADDFGCVLHSDYESEET